MSFMLINFRFYDVNKIIPGVIFTNNPNDLIVETPLLHIFLWEVKNQLFQDEKNMHIMLSYLKNIKLAKAYSQNFQFSKPC